MSTDTTSNTERIQRLAGDIADRYPESETHAATQAIIANADALDAARRDAEARAERLNDALLIVAAIADERGKRLSPYSPDTLSEDAQSEMGLHPGDVDKGGAS